VSDYFDRVERQIVQSVEAGAPRARRGPTALGYLATAAAVAVVIVVVSVFLLAHGSNPVPTPAAGNGVTVTFTASTIDPHAQLGPAIDRSVVILRERLRTVAPGIRVERDGIEIVVTAPTANAARARILGFAAPGRLEMFDWEANAITPNGKTVASQLASQNAAALEISQGSGSAAPGDPGAGGVPRRQADALAAKRPGSAVVLATAPSVALGVSAVPASARFYVLANLLPALSNRDIAHPKEVRDPNAGGPDVTFGFTSAGAVAFRALTKRVAERGQRLSSLGQTFNQHFAIALDGRLISVPYIDFKAYPDGITTQNRANISGGFTTQSARDLATILRYGPLPARLTATG
jgi:preprotein translocase subunit SecD